MSGAPEYPIAEDSTDLSLRIHEFASMLNVSATALRSLVWCSYCEGFDTQWDDPTSSDFAENGFVEPYHTDGYNYRKYLSQNVYTSCDSSGFDGGDFNFTEDEWFILGSGQMQLFKFTS